MKKDKSKIKKSLSQNYLVDRSLLRKIANLNQENSPVWTIEVAAGTGWLTTELLKQSQNVIAIEIEKSSIEELKNNIYQSKNGINPWQNNLPESKKKILANKRLFVWQADVLDIPFTKLFDYIEKVSEKNISNNIPSLPSKAIPTKDNATSYNTVSYNTLSDYWESASSHGTCDIVDIQTSDMLSHLAKINGQHAEALQRPTKTSQSRTKNKDVDVSKKNHISPSTNSKKINANETQKSAVPPNLPTYSICGNLPYKVATSFILSLLEDIYHCPSKNSILNIHFLVQKEVAQRLSAITEMRTPSKKRTAVGATSYLLAWHGFAHICFQIKPGSFYPKPNVMSALISIKLHTFDYFNGINDEDLSVQLTGNSKPSADSAFGNSSLSVSSKNTLALDTIPNLYFVYKACVKAAFMQRRKTVAKSLLNNFNPNALGEKLWRKLANDEQLLPESSLSLKTMTGRISLFFSRYPDLMKKRPDELTVYQYISLAKYISLT